MEVGSIGYTYLNNRVKSNKSIVQSSIKPEYRGGFGVLAPKNLSLIHFCGVQIKSEIARKTLAIVKNMPNLPCLCCKKPMISQDAFWSISWPTPPEFLPKQALSLSKITAVSVTPVLKKLDSKFPRKFKKKLNLSYENEVLTPFELAKKQQIEYNTKLIAILGSFKKNLGKIESEIFEILKEKHAENPETGIKETLLLMRPEHLENLKKDQFKVLKEIYKIAVDRIITIKKDATITVDEKAERVKKYEAIKELLSETKNIIVDQNSDDPFKRKVFIKKLRALVKTLPKAKAIDQIIELAMKMPNSHNNLSAFIVKYSAKIRESKEAIDSKPFESYLEIGEKKVFNQIKQKWDKEYQSEDLPSLFSASYEDSLKTFWAKTDAVLNEINEFGDSTAEKFKKTFFKSIEDNNEEAIKNNWSDMEKRAKLIERFKKVRTSLGVTPGNAVLNKAIELPYSGNDPSALLFKFAGDFKGLSKDEKMVYEALRAKYASELNLKPITEQIKESYPSHKKSLETRQKAILKEIDKLALMLPEASQHNLQAEIKQALENLGKEDFAADKIRTAIIEAANQARTSSIQNYSSIFCKIMQMPTSSNNPDALIAKYGGNINFSTLTQSEKSIFSELIERYSARNDRESFLNYLSESYSSATIALEIRQRAAISSIETWVNNLPEGFKTTANKIITPLKDSIESEKNDGTTLAEKLLDDTKKVKRSMLVENKKISNELTFVFGLIDKFQTQNNTQMAFIKYLTDLNRGNPVQTEEQFTRLIKDIKEDGHLTELLKSAFIGKFKENVLDFKDAKFKLLDDIELETAKNYSSISGNIRAIISRLRYNLQDSNSNGLNFNYEIEKEFEKLNKLSNSIMTKFSEVLGKLPTSTSDANALIVKYSGKPSIEKIGSGEEKIYAIWEKNYNATLTNQKIVPKLKADYITSQNQLQSYRQAIIFQVKEALGSAPVAYRNKVLNLINKFEQRIKENSVDVEKLTQELITEVKKLSYAEQLQALANKMPCSTNDIGALITKYEGDFLNTSLSKDEKIIYNLIKPEKSKAEIDDFIDRKIIDSLEQEKANLKEKQNLAFINLGKEINKQSEDYLKNLRAIIDEFKQNMIEKGEVDFGQIRIFKDKVFKLDALSVGDRNLIEHKIAKLPTPSNDESAFIIKFANKVEKLISIDEEGEYVTCTSERIAKSMIEASTMTEEHIVSRHHFEEPQIDLGVFNYDLNNIKNIGLDCKGCNNESSSDSFYKRVKRNPEIPKNAQYQADFMLQNASKEELPFVKSYLSGISGTLNPESKGLIKLDLSKYEEIKAAKNQTVPRKQRVLSPREIRLREEQRERQRLENLKKKEIEENKRLKKEREETKKTANPSNKRKLHNK